MNHDRITAEQLRERATRAEAKSAMHAVALWPAQGRQLADALRLVVDAMRRSDMAYCSAHGIAHVTDEEWDAALQAGEDALEEAA